MEHCKEESDISSFLAELDVPPPDESKIENQIAKMNNQLNFLCGCMQEIAKNQQETIDLLKKFISHPVPSPAESPTTSRVVEYKTTERKNGVNTKPKQSLAWQFPNLVYVKQKGMALLLKINYNQTKKVWCGACNCKVSVKNNSHEGISQRQQIQSTCGHLISCEDCWIEIFQQLCRCLHCSPHSNTNSNQTFPKIEPPENLDEHCPVCDSVLPQRFNQLVSAPPLNVYVIVNPNIPNQCSHQRTQTPIYKEPTSRRSTGKRSRPVVISDNEDENHNNPPKLFAVPLQPQQNNANDVNNPTNQQNNANFNENDDFPFGGVLQIGKKAIQVGSNLLSRMSYYEDDEHGFLF